MKKPWRTLRPHQEKVLFSGWKLFLFRPRTLQVKTRAAVRGHSMTVCNSLSILAVSHIVCCQKIWKTTQPYSYHIHFCVRSWSTRTRGHILLIYVWKPHTKVLACSITSCEGESDVPRNWWGLECLGGLPTVAFPSLVWHLAEITDSISAIQYCQPRAGPSPRSLLSDQWRWWCLGNKSSRLVWRL